MSAPSLPRDGWHLRANIPTFAYLVVTVLVALGHRWLDDPGWLLVHLLLLGAATNAIFVWSAHFTQTLLRLPSDTGRGALAWRIAVLNAGALLVLGGAVVASPPAMMLGAVLVAAAALAHGWVLFSEMRRALPARFRPLVRFYVAAACFLPVGSLIGAEMSTEHDDAVTGRLLLAHMAANVLGWIGLTVAGTLVQLWPTMLRTRMAEGTELAARHALPVLIGGILVALLGAGVGVSAVCALGLVVYLLGWIRLLWPHARSWSDKPPDGFAPWSVIAALFWLAVAVVIGVVILATTTDWAVVDERLILLALPFAGFVLQILLGALTFLIPVVLGGGPAAVRATIAILDRGDLMRLAATNVGLAMAVVPLPNEVRLAGGAIALVGAASFLPIAGLAVVRNRQAKANRPTP